MPICKRWVEDDVFLPQYHGTWRQTYSYKHRRIVGGCRDKVWNSLMYNIVPQYSPILWLQQTYWRRSLDGPVSAALATHGDCFCIKEYSHWKSCWGYKMSCWTFKINKQKNNLRTNLFRAQVRHYTTDWAKVACNCNPLWPIHHTQEANAILTKNLTSGAYHYP